MARYYQRFQVKCGPMGFHFPIDMLRYDHCWPANEVETHLFCGRVQEGTTVWLNRDVDNKDQAPTRGRWESFGWTVETVETRKYS